MDVNSHAISWFEIPVTDIARAKHFYQVIFSIHMHEDERADMHMAFFPFMMENRNVSGALVKSEFHRPNLDGVIIYLNANPDLSSVLEKVEAEHGRILMPKTQISPEYGFMAIIQDLEGNRIGLHSVR